MAKNKAVLVIAIQSFASMIGGELIQVAKGKVVSMPEGADWVKAGLVVPAGESGKETADKTTPETATKKSAGSKATVTSGEKATDPAIKQESDPVIDPANKQEPEL